MRFLVDAQLPPGLALHLRLSGHEAVHVVDILPGDAPDSAIMDEARRMGAVIVTKDQDFADFARAGKITDGVLWLRIGNVTNRALLRKLEPLMPRIIAAFEAAETLVEVD